MKRPLLDNDKKTWQLWAFHSSCWPAVFSKLRGWIFKAIYKALNLEMLFFLSSSGLEHFSFHNHVFGKKWDRTFLLYNSTWASKCQTNQICIKHHPVNSSMDIINPHTHNSIALWCYIHGEPQWFCTEASSSPSAVCTLFWYRSSTLVPVDTKSGCHWSLAAWTLEAGTLDQWEEKDVLEKYKWKEWKDQWQN